MNQRLERAGRVQLQGQREQTTYTGGAMGKGHGQGKEGMTRQRVPGPGAQYPVPQVPARVQILTPMPQAS